MCYIVYVFGFESPLASFVCSYLNTTSTLKYVMRFDNAAKIVAGSSLMEAIVQRYGVQWTQRSWIRATLAGYIGALEGTSAPDDILDEMEDMAERIRAHKNSSNFLVK